MVWLRVEKGCILISRERCLRYWAGQPDVMGISKGRHVLEIEIKRTVSDFRADGKKRHRQNRHKFLDLQPRQFWYLMPDEVAAKVQDEIPDWAGLMVNDPNWFGVKVIKKAPPNNQSKKLSLEECVRAVTHQTNFILSLESENDRLRRAFVDGAYQWNPPLFEI